MSCAYINLKFEMEEVCMATEKEKKQIGERLKLARTINNLSLEDVYKITGTPKGTLSRYESGAREPGDDLLEKLASTYKISKAFFKKGTLDLSHPGGVLFDLNTKSWVDAEMSKEEFEMTRKILSEKVKQKVSEKIQKLNSETLLPLLNLDEEHLIAVSLLLKNSSIMSSIKSLNYYDIPKLNKLEEFIDELASS